MNINKAAKLLIKLGIPGKEKERAVKDAVKDRTFKNTRTHQKEALEEVRRKAPRPMGIHRRDHLKTGITGKREGEEVRLVHPGRCGGRCSVVDEILQRQCLS